MDITSNARAICDKVERYEKVVLAALTPVQLVLGWVATPFLIGVVPVHSEYVWKLIALYGWLGFWIVTWLASGVTMYVCSSSWGRVVAAYIHGACESVAFAVAAFIVRLVVLNFM